MTTMKTPKFAYTKFAYMFTGEAFEVHLWVVRVWETHEPPEGGWNQKKVRNLEERSLPRYVVSKLKCIWTNHVFDWATPQRDGEYRHATLYPAKRNTPATLQPVVTTGRKKLAFTIDEAKEKFKAHCAEARHKLTIDAERLDSSIAYYEGEIAKMRESRAQVSARQTQLGKLRPRYDYDAKEAMSEFRGVVKTALQTALADAVTLHAPHDEFLKNLPPWHQGGKLAFETREHDGQTCLVPKRELSDGTDLLKEKHSLGPLRNRVEAHVMTLNRAQERLDNE